MVGQVSANASVSAGAGPGGARGDIAVALIAGHRRNGSLDTAGLAAEVKAQAAEDPKGAAALKAQVDAHLSPVEQGEFDAALAGKSGDGKGQDQEGVGAFFDGAIRGDFSSNNSWSKLAGQTAMGFVPIAGQIADARDTAAAIGKVWRGEDGGWLNLGAAVVGWVPGVGDAAKGLIRGGEHVAVAGEKVAAKTLKAGEQAGEKAALKTEAKAGEKAATKAEVKTEAKADAKAEADAAAAAGKVRKFQDAASFNEAANHAVANTRYEYGKYAYETDGLGRVKVSEGEISLNATGRNDNKLQTQIGHEGKSTDVGFHLIADRFGGQTNRLNVVPGNGHPIGDGLPNLNQGPYKNFENTVAKLAENPKNKVEVRIEARYDPANKSSRPDGFEASYRVNGGLWATQTFVNK